MEGTVANSMKTNGLVGPVHIDLDVDEIAKTIHNTMNLLYNCLNICQLLNVIECRKTIITEIFTGSKIQYWYTKLISSSTK